MGFYMIPIPNPDFLLSGQIHVKKIGSEKVTPDFDLSRNCRYAPPEKQFLIINELAFSPIVGFPEHSRCI